MSDYQWVGFVCGITVGIKGKDLIVGHSVIRGGAKQMEDVCNIIKDAHEIGRRSFKAEIRQMLLSGDDE